MNMKISLQSFNTDMFYDIELVDKYTIRVSYQENSLQFSVLQKNEIFTISDLNYTNDDVTCICIEAIFILFPKDALAVEFSSNLILNNFEFQNFIKNDLITLERSSFSSIQNIWSKALNSENHEEIVTTLNVNHPKRAPYRSGELLYRKYYSSINKTLSFRVLDLDKDLDKFHEWHNKKFIYNFWELNKSKEELREYLNEGLSDPHSIPTILEFDNQPIGYFEFYWAKEDRLGPFYNFSDYDRGFHFLIGEESCLGKNNVDSVLKATGHYTFLTDKRTKLLAGEPRSDNKRIIRYINHFECWRKEKEFDFPHKRAALLLCDRDIFFKEGCPWI